MTPLEIQGVEVFRSRPSYLDKEAMVQAARIVSSLGHVPVMQLEGEVVVLYAIRTALFRKAKRYARGVANV